MKKASIPTKDKELLDFALGGKAQVVADAAGYGLTADFVDNLASAVDEFESVYREHEAAQETARVARQKKDLSRKKLRKLLGSYVRMMRSQPDLSPAKLVAFGVKPTDKLRTPVSAPEIAPVVRISHENYSHIIRFWEEGSRRKRRKPDGVIGAEVYVNLGGDRDDLKAYQLKGTLVRSPHVFNYEMNDLGKTVHYYLVWLTRRGDRSPRSLIESATIAI